MTHESTVSGIAPKESPTPTSRPPRPTDVAHHEAAEQDRREGNQLIAGGVALGAFGAATAALAGATCPLCVVVAPALAGAGLYRRWRARRASKGEG